MYKDAVYFSPHKFVGGVDSPGRLTGYSEIVLCNYAIFLCKFKAFFCKCNNWVAVLSTVIILFCHFPVGILVAKKKLLSNKTPHSCGGGTVFFVTPTDHCYFKEEEMREEGGTPSIIGSIRAGLAIQLKEAVGTEWIMAREEELCRLVFQEWEPVHELVVVGPHSIPRLPVFSFLIRHLGTGRFLHHNYVCTLLNDLFGIQARGGCSCAGPYAQVHNNSVAYMYACMYMVIISVKWLSMFRDLVMKLRDTIVLLNSYFVLESVGD